MAARALENFADCPVKWLVENVLRPDELVPDPEAMVRGSYAHEVLSQTYRRLHEETGERRVTHDNLADAERILLEELRDQSAAFQLSPKQTRVRAAARRLEFDLLRYLRSEADPTTGSNRSSSSVRSAWRAASPWSSKAGCGCAAASTASTNTTAWRS